MYFLWNKFELYLHEKEQICKLMVYSFVVVIYFSEV